MVLVDITEHSVGVKCSEWLVRQLVLMLQCVKELDGGGNENVQGSISTRIFGTFSHCYLAVQPAR